MGVSGEDSEYGALWSVKSGHQKEPNNWFLWSIN